MDYQCSGCSMQRQETDLSKRNVVHQQNDRQNHQKH